MIAIDPQQTFNLEIDRQDSKPYLKFHYATAREYLRMISLLEQADKAKESDDIVKLHLESIKVCLIGYGGFTDREGNPVTYDGDNLLDVLTLKEVFKVSNRALATMNPSEDDIKKSGSLLQSATDNVVNQTAQVA